MLKSFSPVYLVIEMEQWAKLDQIIDLYYCVRNVRIWSFSVFFRMRTESRETLRVSPYSVQMWENTD